MKAHLITSAPKAKPELLAPAGSVEAFYAAIESGADAVYCGTRQFNARLRAKNFSLDDLARLIAVARGAGRKVYVTLNTLVKEEELPALAELLADLRIIGPDALIIQDLGVYRLARRLAPEIPLHASTQMTIHNLDGALQAQRMGFARAILAREATFDEIRRIRSGCEIQLETFIQGAMCYSVSGQCYFSSYAHGRSANRGLCMQPCRRLYKDLRFAIDDLRLPKSQIHNPLAAGQGKSAARQSSIPNRESSIRGQESSIVNRQSSIFSPPDLCAATILSRLISVGIHAFKIEGRLKSAESVAQTVSAYRLLIDAYPDVAPEIMNEARARLERSLGRRAATGFYRSSEGAGAGAGGDSSQSAAPAEGESRLEAQSGRSLGKVLRVLPQDPRRFMLAAREWVKAGDGLRVHIAAGAAPRAFTIKKMFLGAKRVTRARPGEEVWIEAPLNVPVGAQVMKVRDADASAQEGKRKVEEKWERAAELVETHFDERAAFSPERKAALKAVQKPMPLPPATAQKLEAFSPECLIQVTSVDKIRKQGSVDWGPKDRGQGSGARGQDEQGRGQGSGARGQDEQGRGQGAEIRGQEERSRWQEAKERAKGSRGREEQGSGGGRVGMIVPLGEVERRDYEEQAEKAAAIGEIILELPQISFEEADRRQEILASLERAVELGARRFMVSNLAHFNLLQRVKRRGFFVIASPLSGCLNSESLSQFEELGVSLIAYSIEGDAQTLERLIMRTGPERVAVQVYGKIPLFRSRQPWPEVAPSDEKRSEEKRPVEKRSRENRPEAKHSEGKRREILALDPRDELWLERREGLTCVVPARDFSLLRRMDWLRSLGVRHFIYDLRWSSDVPQRIADLAAGKLFPRPRAETMMNFERGLS